jgi:hypothetical protein
MRVNSAEEFGGNFYARNSAGKNGGKFCSRKFGGKKMSKNFVAENSAWMEKNEIRF